MILAGIGILVWSYEGLAFTGSIRPCAWSGDASDSSTGTLMEMIHPETLKN